MGEADLPAEEEVMSALPTVRSRQDAIALLEQGRRLIAEAKKVWDVKLLRDQAAAVAHYLRQQHAAYESIQDAAELKLRAERRLGELLANTVNHKGSRGVGIIVKPTLPDGVSKLQSHRWQRVASLPLDLFEHEIAAARRRKQEITTTAVLILAERELRRRQHDQARRHMAAEAVPCDAIRCGDFREALADLPDNSVDLIFTDPPYQDKFRGLYGDVAELAGRVLRPGGSLLVYSPPYAVADVSPRMTCRGLRFWSALAVPHRGVARHLNFYHLTNAFKLLLWFVRGRYRGRWVCDLIPSTQPNQVAHEWQQSETEASYVISKMTRPGELVLDPMVGSGTTLLAARRLGRRVLGCEIVPARAKVAAARVAGLVPEDMPTDRRESR